MANIAKVTQSFLIAGTVQAGKAKVTQSYIIAGVGVGIACGNPPAGTLGLPYTTTFPAGGGEAPLIYGLAAGTFPPGLTLNPTTGVLSGTPTTAGTYFFTIQVTDAFGAVATANCSITIGGSIVPNNPQAGGGGAGIGSIHGRATLCGRHKNAFDWCMFAQALTLRDITFPPSCSVPKEYRDRYPLPWGEDFGNNAIPEQAVPFRSVNAVVTPAAAAGDVLVTSERVPYGYDGLMVAFFTTYTGQGFDQGSGDIVWRLQLNQRYLPELGSLAFAVGSAKSPCPLTQGQIVLSGQQMRLLVNVPNLSGNIQVGGSRIIGGLIGFYWPR